MRKSSMDNFNCLVLGTSYAAAYINKLPGYITNSAELVCQLQHQPSNDDCVLLQADIENTYPSVYMQDG